jgi:hypothetical protein
MGLVLFTERHKEEIVGVISCYDRILIQGLAGVVLCARDDDLPVRSPASHL